MGAARGKEKGARDMSREKTAEFLADCLAQMPDQPEQVQRVVDMAIDGLKMIAQGGEWSRDEALAAADAAMDAGWASANAAEWAVIHAAEWAAYAPIWAADASTDSAASAHPNPDKERARQEQKRIDIYGIFPQYSFNTP